MRAFAKREQVDAVEAHLAAGHLEHGCSRCVAGLQLPHVVFIR